MHADNANVVRLSRETIFMLESYNVPVQSATEWTAPVHTLHMSKPVITFVFKVLRATEWTASVHSLHMPRAQTCDYVRVRSATEWTASVDTLHMPKPVITFLTFKMLRNGLLRYILYTCPPVITFVFKVLYGMDCFGTYFTNL